MWPKVMRDLKKSPALRPALKEALVTDPFDQNGSKG
jgi:hypothetical protein